VTAPPPTRDPRRRPPRAAALVPVAVLAAVCACFVHPTTVTFATFGLPVGLVLALGGTAGVLAMGTLLSRTRWGSGAVAAAWLVTVVMLSLPRPEGDVVIAQDAVGLTFLGVGVVLAGVSVGLPAGGLGYHGRLAAVSPQVPGSP
jgi:Family of unknown function (DUF6113)